MGRRGRGARDGDPTQSATARLPCYTSRVSPADLDAELTRNVASALRAPWLTPLLVLLSAWIVKGPLLASLAAAQPGPLARRLRAVGVVAVAALLGSLAAAVIKLLVDRTRPPEVLGIEALVALPTTASFPSGHATTAAAAATALALLVPRWRLLAVSLALLVGASRVLLGVHFVGDVLAGLALGAAIGAVVSAIGRRWLEATDRDREDAGAPSDGPRTAPLSSK